MTEAEIKNKIKDLTEKKSELEAELREVKFKKDKMESELKELEENIATLFGTKDVSKLEAKKAQIVSELDKLLKELNGEEVEEQEDL